MGDADISPSDALKCSHSEGIANGTYAPLNCVAANAALCNSGDRECPLRDAPGRMDEVVRSAEDPITAMRGSKGGATLTGGFQLLVDEDCVRGGMQRVARTISF